jgi:anti-sigma B factor antagonist
MAVGSNGTNRPLNSLDGFCADHVVVVMQPPGEDMSLAISSRIVSGVVIVDIVGRLCFLDVALGERVNEWLKEGYRAFVLNLANVSYVDSSGLGQLITISTSIQSKGGQLILLRPTDHLRALFQITKLNTVFNISADEAHAVRSVRTNAVEPVLHAISAESSLP